MHFVIKASKFACTFHLDQSLVLDEEASNFRPGGALQSFLWSPLRLDVIASPQTLRSHISTSSGPIFINLILNCSKKRDLSNKKKQEIVETKYRGITFDRALPKLANSIWLFFV